MTFPTVSVVLPVYNGENFIRQALESVLSQDFKDYEIIVGINQSSDSTVEIVESILGSNHPGIIIFEDRVSMVENFNRTTAKAVGKYIKFLCHDDVLHPNALRLLLSEFNQRRNLVLATSYESFLSVEKPSRAKDSFGSKKYVAAIQSLYRFSKYGNWLGGPSGVMVKSEIFKKTFFDESLVCAFDLDCWIQLSRHGGISVVPQELYSSRLHPNQGTHFCTQGGFSEDLAKIRIKYLYCADPTLRLIFKVFG